MQVLFAAHLDIEFKIFGYGYFVFRVCHGNIFLSLPRGYVLIEVGIQLIFVFEYGSFFHRRNGKLHLHVSFVQAFFKYQVAFHLRAHYLSVFQIVSRCVYLADALFHKRTVRM